MARNTNTESSFEEQAEAATTTATEGTQAAAAADGADGRHIVITDPDNGQPIKRVDFIKREVIQRGRARGEVAKQLSQIQGKKVPYQIVFAATKGYKPSKPEAAPAAEAAAESTAG